MNYLAHLSQSDFFSPRTALGAVILGVLFLVAAIGLAAFVRRGARRLRVHLSDVTGLAFASALGQVFVYVVASVSYTHLAARHTAARSVSARPSEPKRPVGTFQHGISRGAGKRGSQWREPVARAGESAAL